MGIGGDPINGLKHIDIMQAFNDDPDTDAVIMIGEIGGPDEAEAARWCKANMKKPIVGFIAGVTAPAGKRMGHAGALISGGADTADAKLAIMEECGFTVTRNPSEMGQAAEEGDLAPERRSRAVRRVRCALEGRLRAAFLAAGLRRTTHRRPRCGARTLRQLPRHGADRAGTHCEDACHGAVHDRPISGSPWARSS